MSLRKKRLLLLILIIVSLPLAVMSAAFGGGTISFVLAAILAASIDFFTDTFKSDSKK